MDEDTNGGDPSSAIAPAARQPVDVVAPAYQPCLGYLAETGTPKGLGVFASRDIAAGETVEVAHVVQIKSDYNSLVPEVQCRVFHWERLASLPGVYALALGYGSMYNHSNPANLRYAAEAEGKAIRFVAVVDIPAREELTINYNDTGGEPDSEDDNWFEQFGITPYAASGAGAMSAYSVRCLFRWPARGDQVAKHLYEERITLWQAHSLDAAIELAEREAEGYASKKDASLEFFEAYPLADRVAAHGVEVFSLLRASDLEPNDYIDAFFASEPERPQ